EAITPRTKAIVPVHYAGVGCEMDAIMGIAQHHKIPVLEDNAHALFAKYKGKYMGTFGSMAAQSFHETKNFSCGEGGALLINDHKLVERAEIVREKGTNRSRFFRGQVDKYTWVDIGSSYLPSDILAGVLYAQLEEREKIQAYRKTLWETYHFALKDWAEKENIQLPTVPEHTEQAYHMFYILLPNLDARQKFIAYLREHDIHSVFHYLPLHLSDMGIRLGGRPDDFPITEDVSNRLVRLPFSYGLSSSEQEQVIDSVLRFKVL
ncbi:MAG: dTDP-4-amino-4,6-dideoxygalactose transaminase, partial [Anaerolineae bacterium]|nr:dTDP-4-amino-4,6-dideoxygalactose transaminase [Anaerolineae bacterium]